MAIGITSDTSEVSSRASALEAIVSNDYIDLLNSSPIIKLLHAKWVRGARGHYFGQLGLFCSCLVVYTVLCAHRRQGIMDAFTIGLDPPILKKAIQSPTMCMPPYSATTVASNGSVVVTTGYGPFDCSVNSSYNHDQQDVESMVLEVGTFALAILVRQSARTFRLASCCL